MIEPQIEAEGPMTPDEAKRLAETWLERIQDSEKRNAEWMDEANNAVRAYTGRRSEQGSGEVYDFNVFHANVETILPAVYNSTPIPDIRERFRSGRSFDGGIARTAAQILERALAYQIDDGKLDNAIEPNVLDALLAGRGVLRLRFDADVREGDPMTGDPGGLSGECVKFEPVAWRDYREGPAQRWADVPWIGFRHCLPKEEVDRIADPELRRIFADSGRDEISEEEHSATSHVWEIWDRETKRVYMLTDGNAEILSITDDPYGLRDFFPMPEPLQPLSVAGSRMPIVPFSIYRALCEEVDRLSKRIKSIVDGMRVVGIFVGDMQSVEAISNADDNTLVPIGNMEGLAHTGGLDKAIMWWPLDQAVRALSELYRARESTKQMVYEVTGISDIVRGQGKASETATAQEIKSQWGSLRIRKMQRLIERQVREVFVIAAEIVVSKFTPETLQKIAAMQVPPEAMQLLTGAMDHYRIDVESDSTVRADLSRRKGEMGEFLQGTAQFFATMAPLVQQAPQMAAPVAQMYAAFARQFSLGKQAEDAIEDMADMAQEAAQQAMQQAQGPSPEEKRAEAEIELDNKRLALDERIAEINALETMSRIDQPPRPVRQ